MCSSESNPTYCMNRPAKVVVLSYIYWDWNLINEEQHIPSTYAYQKAALDLAASHAAEQLGNLLQVNWPGFESDPFPVLLTTKARFFKRTSIALGGQANEEWESSSFI